MTLKIAIVSDAVYPYNIGGKEKRIFEISTRLAKKGNQVTIYCMKWWKGKENSRKENGVTLKAISPYYPLYSGPRRSFKQAILFALFTFKLLREDFDIIDADHMPHLVLFPLKVVSLLKRKKLYVTWNEVWGKAYWKKYLGTLGTVAYLIEKLSVKLPDEIISISANTTTKLSSVLNVKQKIYTIPMGVDLEKIKKVKPSPTKSDVIYAGRLLSHKNVDFLIKSISLLKKDYPKIKCLIVGQGPEEKKLKNLANQLNLQENIIFYDFLENHNDLYALMKSSKIFVLPSTREGFGIVALEANASGIPVITTDHDNNATKDLIGDGKNGHIIKLDTKVLANKINNLLMIKNTKNYINHVKIFDWKYITSKIGKVYKI